MTDTPNTDPDRTETANKVIAALRQGYGWANRRMFKLNEADTRSLIVSPVLDALGYDPGFRKSENSGDGNRPDECLFVETVSSLMKPVAVFVEVKPLDADFDSAMELGRADSPTRQIQRYLIQHPASDLNSIGVLTDGFRYRIYQRVSESDNRLVADLNLRRIGHMHSRFLDSVLDESVRDVHELVTLISRQSRIDAGFERLKPIRLGSADRFFDSFSNSIEPRSVLEALLKNSSSETQGDVVGIAGLQGKAKDLHDNDWRRYETAEGPKLNLLSVESEQGELDTQVHIPVAAIHFTRGNLSRNDVALTARVFAGKSKRPASVVIVYAQPSNGSSDELHARFAVTANGQVSMTPEFDPNLPLPSVRKAVTAILELIRNAPEEGVTAEALAAPLGVNELQQRFYRDVAGWVKKHQLGQETLKRQAVLQHLIRLMFTWILKESNQLPSAPFDAAFVDSALDDLDSYHTETLSFMFHERLNVEKGKRQPHENKTIDDALNSVPYLNGSLFMRNSTYEGLFEPNGDDYWSPDANEPGIYTILARYHWTLDEKRPGVNEQTLDPELLSNLFERLIAPTDAGHEYLKTMPGGTYYTPPDVANEMAKDALTAASRRHAGELTDAQLRQLFDHEHTDIPNVPMPVSRRLRERITSLEILDPAVGSGAFLFSILNALHAAVAKLGGVASVEDIIGRQLFGQDIHPLAVQITKLRLFIAIQAERAREASTNTAPGPNTSDDIPPLPNLEARVVCADTLATIPDLAWSPLKPNRLDGADSEVQSLLAELAKVRSAWYNAHAEDEKMRILAADAQVRDALRSVLQDKGDLSSPELLALADAELLSSKLTPTAVDPRLLYYTEGRNGFDIVIGNPPYEKLFANMNKPGRNAEITRLKEEKGYSTTKVNNLYSLFCEVGLTLTARDGVFTMIMPHSVAFGEKQKGLRKLFESRCSWIETRHYDNRPDTIFSSSPMVQSPENRQRATIVNAIIGKSETVRLGTTGLMKWRSSEREECLYERAEHWEVRGSETNGVPHHGDQWPRIPTNSIAELIKRIDEQTVDMLGTENGASPSLSIPRSAYLYVSVTPTGDVAGRGETPIQVNGSFDFRLAMAAANSHIGFAWWLVFGSGFNVKQSDFFGFSIPDEWITHPDEPIRLGQQLIDAMPSCTVENRFQGSTFKNVDFHSGRPDLIEKIDRLYIEALGLPVEPLLTHLRIMRSNSSWNFPE